jgi:hypothetical protein
VRTGCLCNQAVGNQTPAPRASSPRPLLQPSACVGQETLAAGVDGASLAAGNMTHSTWAMSPLVAERACATGSVGCGVGEGGNEDAARADSQQQWWWFAEDQSSLSSVDDCSSSAAPGPEPAAAEANDARHSGHGMRPDGTGAPRCVRCELWKRNQVFACAPDQRTTMTR